MGVFTADETALKQIEEIFRISNCTDPVARIYERASADLLFDEPKAATFATQPMSEQLKRDVKKRFKEVEGKLVSELMVGPCERIEFEPADLHEINGITFVLSAGALEMLRDYCLIFENGRFFLRGPDNMLYTLRTLGKTLS